MNGSNSDSDFPLNRITPSPTPIISLLLIVDNYKMTTGCLLPEAWGQAEACHRRLETLKHHLTVTNLGRARLNCRCLWVVNQSFICLNSSLLASQSFIFSLFFSIFFLPDLFGRRLCWKGSFPLPHFDLVDYNIYRIWCYTPDSLFMSWHQIYLQAIYTFNSHLGSQPAISSTVLMHLFDDITLKIQMFRSRECKKGK